MALIKNRSYVTLVTAQFIEQVGDSLTLMSLILWASAITTASGSSSTSVSIMMFFVGVPIILLGPFAGVFIDRVRKKSMLLSAAAVKGCAALCIFLFIKDAGGGSAPFIYFLAMIFSAGAQFFLPAKSAFIPDLVVKKDLATANSVSAVVTVLVLIAGFAAAGFVTAAIGVRKTVLIAVAAYVITPFFLAAVGHFEEKKTEKQKAREIWGEFKDGMSHLFGSNEIKFIARRVSVLMVTIGVFFVALSGKYLRIILDYTGLGMQHSQALGLMLAVLGAGLVAGTIITDRLNRAIGEKNIIRVVYPVLGACVIILFYFPNYYFLLGAGFGAGAGGALVLGLAETVIQKNTSAALRGRLFAAYYFIRNSSTTAGTTLAGALAIIMDEPGIILLCGGGLALYWAVSLAAQKLTEIKRGKNGKMP